MQNNPVNLQDALARAREIASKLTAAAPNASLKRSNNDDDYSNKRLAVSSPNGPAEVTSPILRAQQIAQQINSQLGVKGPATDPTASLSNQISCQEDYRIPDKFVGLVIGKGGEQIIRLQAESGCKVQICQTRQESITNGPNAPDRIANLSGSREAIDHAKRIMDDIISRGKMADGAPVGINPYSLGGTNSKSIDVMLPSAKCGLIIGKGGETIRRISEEFSVKMFVVQETTDIDGIEHKPLRIIGENDRIERAKQYVLDSLSRSGPQGGANRFGGNSTGGSSTNDYGSRTGGSSSNGPCNEAAFPVPYDKAGVIIGKGGESIKEIIRKSGAFVEIDKAYRSSENSSGERLFKIRGTPDQIANAQYLMFEKVANSQGGPGDIITPLQFQQKFNLPLVGPTSTDPWAAGADPYSNANSSTDYYSQWANAYGQWPQMAGYDDGTGKSSNGSSANAAGAGAMDPTAWYNYYQSMNLYMMQSSAGSNTSSGSAPAPPSDSNTNSTTTATNSTTGQPDYSQQWIEYYRSIGQNDMAEQIARQLKDSGANGTSNPSNGNATGSNPGSAMLSSGEAWAAYAQQWAASKSTNASSKSPS